MYNSKKFRLFLYSFGLIRRRFNDKHSVVDRVQGSSSNVRTNYFSFLIFRKRHEVTPTSSKINKKKHDVCQVMLFDRLAIARKVTYSISGCIIVRIVETGARQLNAITLMAAGA